VRCPGSGTSSWGCATPLSHEVADVCWHSHYRLRHLPATSSSSLPASRPSQVTVGCSNAAPLTEEGTAGWVTQAAFGRIHILEEMGGSLVGGAIKLFQNRSKNPVERDADLPPKPEGQTVASYQQVRVWVQ
jgi:hypothetical protein